VKSRDDRSNGPKPQASSAARRVEAIIEGAERAAERVIDEAEANARAYLAEAEAEADRTVEARLAALGELTDALVAQAEAIQRQAELLSRSLREAKQQLEVEGGAAAPGPSPIAIPDAATDPDAANGTQQRERAGAGAELAEAPRTPHLAAVEPAGEKSRYRSFPQPGGEKTDSAGDAEPDLERRGAGSPAGARLLATQMAVSGSTREEIAARLRTGFEIEDTDAILDAILGPEAEA
jgi:hypothetical protein